MAGIDGNLVCEVLTGSYEVKFHNYSKLDKTVGASIWSPTINLVGRQWSLRIYLGGYTEESKEYISIFLCNEQRNSEVKASVGFSLKNQVNKKSGHSIPTPVYESTFTQLGSANNGWGYDKFVKRSVIADANSPFIVDDVVIFRIVVEIVNNHADSSDLVAVAAADCTAEPFRLPFCDSGLVYDVSFVILDAASRVVDRIQAHKCMLMIRSPVFKAMFTHNMSESNTNEIVISDFSPEVIREMLHFMYTDKLQSKALDNIVYEGLLGAAIKYDVLDLIHLCEAYFCKQLTDCRVLDLYRLANATGSEVLKIKCVSYVKNNAERLLNSGRVGDKDRCRGHKGCVMM